MKSAGSFAAVSSVTEYSGSDITPAEKANVPALHFVRTIFRFPVLDLNSRALGTVDRSAADERTITRAFTNVVRRPVSSEVDVGVEHRASTYECA
jgi:hypothetical protein